MSTDFTLTEAEGAHFVKQICQGVEYMHQYVRTNDLCKMTATSNFDSDILAKKINLVTHIDILQNALCTCLYHLYRYLFTLFYLQEIVHLDLKPENIMLCRRDSNR